MTGHTAMHAIPKTARRLLAFVIALVTLVALLFSGSTPAYAAGAVTLDANGGHFIGGRTRITKTTTLLSVANLQRTFGFAGVTPPAGSDPLTVLDGWWTSPTGGTRMPGFSVVTRAVTYYAHWEDATHWVTFDANGGQVDSQSQVQKPSSSAFLNADQIPGSSQITPPSAGSDGLKKFFDGWYSNADGTGTKLNTSSSIDLSTEHHKTFYAHYHEAKNYVTLDAKGLDGEGGSFADGSTSKNVYSSEDAGFVSAADLSAAGVPTRSGWTFWGWVSSPRQFNPTDLSSGLTVSGHETLKAVYLHDTGSITLDANGGYPSTTLSVLSNGELDDPAGVTSPTRSGYTFQGWNTKADGTGTSVTLRNHMLVRSGTTFYAKWKKNPTTPPLGGSVTINLKLPTDGSWTGLPYSFGGNSWNLVGKPPVPALTHTDVAAYSLTDRPLDLFFGNGQFTTGSTWWNRSATYTEQRQAGAFLPGSLVLNVPTASGCYFTYIKSRYACPLHFQRAEQGPTTFTASAGGMVDMKDHPLIGRIPGDPSGSYDVPIDDQNESRLSDSIINVRAWLWKYSDETTYTHSTLIKDGNKFQVPADAAGKTIDMTPDFLIYLSARRAVDSSSSTPCQISWDDTTSGIYDLCPIANSAGTWDDPLSDSTAYNATETFLVRFNVSNEVGESAYGTTLGLDLAPAASAQSDLHFYDSYSWTPSNFATWNRGGVQPHDWSDQHAKYGESNVQSESGSLWRFHNGTDPFSYIGSAASDGLVLLGFSEIDGPSYPANMTLYTSLDQVENKVKTPYCAAQTRDMKGNLSGTCLDLYPVFGFDMVFDANGGTFPDGGTTHTLVPHTACTGGSNASCTISASELESVPEPSDGAHYHFAYWSKNPDGSGDRLYPSDMNADRTITSNEKWYAQYSHDPQLTFDANGGQFNDGHLSESIWAGSDNIVPATALAPYTGSGAYVPLHAPDAGGTHYLFASWNTKPDGSGQTVDLSQPIDLGSPSKHDLTLYAQYRLPRYRVTFHAASGGHVLSLSRHSTPSDPTVRWDQQSEAYVALEDGTHPFTSGTADSSNLSGMDTSETPNVQRVGGTYRATADESSTGTYHMFKGWSQTGPAGATGASTVNLPLTSSGAMWPASLSTDGSTDLYAVYSKITFDLNDRDPNSRFKNQASLDDPYSYDPSGFPSAHWKGHVFMGWAPENSAGTVPTGARTCIPGASGEKACGALSDVSDSTVFQAQWEDVRYRIHYIDGKSGTTLYKLNPDAMSANAPDSYYDAYEGGYGFVRLDNEAHDTWVRTPSAIDRSVMDPSSTDHSVSDTYSPYYLWGWAEYSADPGRDARTPSRCDTSSVLCPTSWDSTVRTQTVRAGDQYNVTVKDADWQKLDKDHLTLASLGAVRDIDLYGLFARNATTLPSAGGTDRSLLLMLPLLLLLLVAGAWIARRRSLVPVAPTRGPLHVAPHARHAA